MRVKNKTSYIIIGLLIIASFLLGSIWTKIRITEQPNNRITEQQEKILGEEEKTFEPPQKETPEVKFFVMSFCPFGNQAEAGLEPVYQLLSKTVKWLPRYVIYGKEYCDRAPDVVECQKKNCQVKDEETWYCAMHGMGELNQNVREICAFNLGDQEKWWQFVSLVNENCNAQDVEECWEAKAKEARLEVAKIKDCQENQALSLLEKEVKECTEYNALGSPMVFINDKLYDGGRAPEDYKKAICSGFRKAPAECEKVLGTTTQGAGGGCQ